MSNIVEKVTILNRADGVSEIELILIGQDGDPYAVTLAGRVDSSVQLGAYASRLDLRITHLADLVSTESDVAAYAG